MLSRHAESLFWIGRYIERAAYITRMLDVAYNKQLEHSGRPADLVWRDLLRVLYLEDAHLEAHGEDLSTGSINTFLVFDRTNRSSVVASVTEARTNVMNVRDIVPIELLEAINRLHTRLLSGALEGLSERSPHEIYETVTEQCRAVTGSIDEAMTRDDGYRFLVMGRMLERAEMTCRMIDVNRTVSGRDGSSWMTVLRSVSGFHAFTRAHGPLAPADRVIRFMLVDPAFPFGVLHSLQRAARLAGEVAGAGAWKSPRVAGRLQADLEFADIPGVDSPALEAMLEQIEAGIREASEAVHNDLYQFGGDPQLYSFEAL
ncbi:MAG: alpha-E domain-containing protein [Acidimicrobiia bacterium]|nr:alpha-E domain-containing protein [Acidimicrobiia bacterium]